MANRAGIVALLIVCLGGLADADRQRRRKQQPADTKPDPAPLPTPAPEPTPPPASADETPWGKGVTAERKAAAETLLGQGNALFIKSEFREALIQYKAAIEQWDHPAIHFNLVRTLIALERPLEAQISLDKALAYGAAPLDDHYTEAVNYKMLIASQIGTLDVSCKQAGVKIKLDGADLLACPGRASKRVLPGTHVVVGTKTGHQTETKDVVVVGGKQLPIDITLMTNAQATVYKSRWAAWKPWAIAGGGAVVVGVGYLVQLQAQGDLETLERAIAATCPPSGCTEARFEELGHADAESRVQLQNRIAIGTMIGGGAIVVAGLVGVVLNRPKPYVKERSTPAVTRLVPTATTTGGGLALEGRF